MFIYLLLHFEIQFMQATGGRGEQAGEEGKPRR